MKLGFLTACLPEAGLVELVKYASKAGFNCLELAAWPVESDRDYQARQIDAATFTQDEAERMLDLFAMHDLEISAFAFYENNIHPDPDKRLYTNNHLKQVIDAAHLLGVKNVGTFVGSDPNLNPAENIKEIGKVFTDLIKYAADKDVNIMIENCPMDHWVKFGLPGNFAYSPELWEALFNELPQDNFGLNFDPSHLYWLGIDVNRAAKDFASKIFHAHAKDAEMLPDGRNRYGTLGQQLEPKQWTSGWWRYRMPGLGEIDWGKFIATLKDGGFEGTLSIEHEDPVWEGTEEKIYTGLAKGREHLAQYI